MSEKKLEKNPKEKSQEESKVEKLSEEELDAVGGGFCFEHPEDTSKPQPQADSPYYFDYPVL